VYALQTCGVALSQDCKRGVLSRWVNGSGCGGELAGQSREAAAEGTGTGENLEQRFAAERGVQRLNRHQPSLIVPRHRVLDADGSLIGYAAGTQRETALWQLERG
jgi:hypothetical protein